MAQWFGPKILGYGVGPRSWQGWLACVATIGAILALRFLFHPQAMGLPPWSRSAAIGGIAAVFLVLVRATYEDDPD